MHDLTAAHKTLPLDTWIKVVNQDNGKTVTVKINDRGPFAHRRIIDLSRAAAEELKMRDKDTARVWLRPWTDPAARRRTGKRGSRARFQRQNPGLQRRARVLILRP